MSSLALSHAEWLRKIATELGVESLRNADQRRVREVLEVCLPVEPENRKTFLLGLEISMQAVQNIDFSGSAKNAAFKILETLLFDQEEVKKLMIGLADLLDAILSGQNV